ncbi:hypothetical protein BDQ17DRAFT_1362685 [Cyathus striatus]|nr:hypothetical protein BDQ17DRAFT_1362685 [Cyathus striatus]
MLNAEDPEVQIKITSAVCTSVAFVTTLYRIYVRRYRFWVDDGFALVSMASIIIQMVAIFMPITNPPRHSGVIRYYLMANAFYAVIWNARLSILFSLIRIDPDPRRQTITLYICVLYFVAFVVLLLQLLWVCEPQGSKWKNMPVPQCSLSDQVAILQLASDITADLFLLILPVRLFVVLQDKWLRYRLIMIFSTCVATTAVSLVHAAFILNRTGVKEVIAAVVEDCVSLIVCNLPVITPALIKLEQRVEERRELTMPSFMIFANANKGEETTFRLSSLRTRDLEDGDVDMGTDTENGNSDAANSLGKTTVGYMESVTFGAKASSTHGRLDLGDAS